MDLRELRYFLAIAQEGSISKAAEALFVSQPSLSKQMKNLEEEIGGALFIRGSRKIELTQLGMILRRRAQEMLDLYSMTESELRAPVGSISGDIFIGGGESHAISVIAEAAKAMKADHPDVRFRFFSGDATEVIEKLEKGLLDFGVLLDYPDTSAFESVTLPLKDRWGALVRKDSDLAALSSVTPRDLEGRPLYLLGTVPFQRIDILVDGSVAGKAEYRRDLQSAVQRHPFRPRGTGLRDQPGQTHQSLRRRRPALYPSLPRDRNASGRRIQKVSAYDGSGFRIRRISEKILRPGQITHTCVQAYPLPSFGSFAIPRNAVRIAAENSAKVRYSYKIGSSGCFEMRFRAFAAYSRVRSKRCA